jgi:hypothetical protein
VSEGLVDELVSEIEDCCNSIVVSCYFEKLVAEAGDISVTKSKGNVRRWKPTPSNGYWSL